MTNTATQLPVDLFDKIFSSARGTATDVLSTSIAKPRSTWNGVLRVVLRDPALTCATVEHEAAFPLEIPSAGIPAGVRQVAKKQAMECCARMLSPVLLFALVLQRVHAEVPSGPHRLDAQITDGYGGTAKLFYDYEFHKDLVGLINLDNEAAVLDVECDHAKMDITVSNATLLNWEVGWVLVGGRSFRCPSARNLHHPGYFYREITSLRQLPADGSQEKTNYKFRLHTSERPFHSLFHHAHIKFSFVPTKKHTQDAHERLRAATPRMNNVIDLESEHVPSTNLSRSTPVEQRRKLGLFGGTHDFKTHCPGDDICSPIPWDCKIRVGGQALLIISQ
jgi:hypothetical protein